MPEAQLGNTSLHYRVRGAGYPVLGIMGFALDQRFWAGQVPMFTSNNTFVSFDNRGIGRSTGPPPESIEQMADDACRVLDELEIETAAVVGTSMGGAIAQRLALAHPARVSALVLAITWARPIEFMRRQHDIARLILRYEDPQALVDVSLVRMFTPRFFEIGQEVIDRMVRSFFADGSADVARSEVLLAQLDAIDKHDAIAELGEIERPTLVVGAKMDMMAPGFASEEIAGAIPGAELKMLETGHGCMVEEMDELNHTVRDFLDRVTP